MTEFIVGTVLSTVVVSAAILWISWPRQVTPGAEHRRPLVHKRNALVAARWEMGK